MRIVIDTGVFWRPLALETLARLHHAVVIPAVVFTERARQIRKRGGDLDAFQGTLQRMHFTMEANGVEHALRFAVGMADDNHWRRHARDAMIAGHLREGDVLWTTNPRDFRSIGVPEAQIVSVQ